MVRKVVLKNALLFKRVGKKVGYWDRNMLTRNISPGNILTLRKSGKNTPNHVTVTRRQHVTENKTLSPNGILWREHGN